MNQFSVLIVDDEVNIVKGLALLVERFLPECQVAGVAYNGEQGRILALELDPDIILTDIRMPQTDGIEMIRQLKAAGSPARFIILSGYAEFEYAKSAISLGVEGYIIKPVEECELCEEFRKICKSLDEEREQMKQVRDMECEVKKYGLKEILESVDDGAEGIRMKLASLDFPLNGKQYLCTVWEQSALNQEASPQCGVKLTDGFYSDLKMAAQLHLGFCHSVPVVPLNKSVAAMILVYDRDDQNNISDGLSYVRQLVSADSEHIFSVGCGTVYSKAEQIRESFEEARCALNYKVVKGPGCMIWYKEISNLQAKQALIDAGDIRHLEECIDSMDAVGCRQVVELIFDKVEQTEHISLVDLQTLSLNLVLMGIRKMPFMQFQLNSYLGSNILSLDSIARFQTVEQLKNWIVNMLKSMNELMLRENLTERKDIIDEIKRYINKNYNKDIRLNDIAEHFYINSNYLSQLFKKRTGETYQKYLTGFRVNRAKKLLEETDLKLYEISIMVGYTDSTYFSRIFERYVNMKPNEYRSHVLTGYDDKK